MADGGTVILENIEALSPRTQVLLERFLDSGHVHRVGTFGPGKPVSTRIIATSGIAPKAADAAGRRHQQLWERLTRTAIHVPSLRERRADIPLLSQFFASGHETGHVGAVFSADAMHALSAYSWPGNVSQLRSVVERLVDGSAGQVLAHDLPVGIRPRQRGNRAAHGQRPTVGEDLFARVKTTGESFWSAVYPLFMKREITRGDLRDLIRRALDAARGNVDGLVRVLNMPGSDRPKFEKFLRKYGCEPPV
jgi:DNA-binding NtrC family response regulator